MTALKYDDVIKTSRDLRYYFDIFEKSYAVPHLSKVSQPRLNWFRSCKGVGGSFCVTPEAI